MFYTLLKTGSKDGVEVIEVITLVASLRWPTCVYLIASGPVASVSFTLAALGAAAGGSCLIMVQR